MATKKKMLQAAAGQAGGAGLDITEVFSTYLYTSAGTSSQGDLIQNGVDLTEEGSLIWTKSRGVSRDHYLVSRESSSSSVLQLISNSTSSASSGSYFAYQSNGYNLPTFPDSTTGTASTTNGEDFASWTFRKAPKFFDVVTYTGDGTNGRAISHNLGSTPGCIFIKCTAGDSRPWAVYHRGTDATSPQNYYLQLNETSARVSDFYRFSNTAPTDAAFTVASSNDTNGNGNTYVAYLFAHNDGDGEFGPDGDQDIIKCGSYTGNGSNDGPEIDLGFEPQWVMIKSVDNADDWLILDSMRGWTTNKGAGIFATPNDKALFANSSSADLSYNYVGLTSTGFQIESTEQNTSGNDYIYMAIRRGPLAQPESADEVFEMDYRGNATSTSPAFEYNFSPDWLFYNQRSNATSSWAVATRLTNQHLNFDNTNAESGGKEWDIQNAYWDRAFSEDTDHISWAWKRAPSFFDVVAYTGNGVAGRTVSHNLGVAPEMMWVKRRDTADNWFVYHSGMNDVDKHLRMNLANDASTSTTRWNSTAPASTEFTLGTDSGVNASGGTYIAYLFATLPGVSKVGSYTGNGSSQTIDCGFTSGARFILIKRTDSISDWALFDSARGIVLGNDPLLRLNETLAEVTDEDIVDPISSGFIVNSVSDRINVSGGTYIFYAIA